jgi:hypothetical protein
LWLDVIGFGARCFVAVGADRVTGQNCGTPLLMLGVVASQVAGASGLLHALPVRRALAALYEDRAARRGAGPAGALRHGPLTLQDATVPVTLHHI